MFGLIAKLPYTALRITPFIRAQLGPAVEHDERLTGLLSQYVTSALRGTARWWVEQDMPYSPAEMAAIFRRLVTNGLAGFASLEAAAEEPTDAE